MENLNGQKVIIIGGSSGIGLATATLAAQEGAQVLIAGRSEERLLAARETIGTSVEIAPIDVTDPASVAALFALHETLNHVVVTAGTFTPTPLLTTPLATMRSTVEEHLWGAVHVVQAAAPRIQTAGSITLLSGIQAERPIPGAAIAGAWAMAMLGLAQGLAVELAPTVRVNVVMPGFIETPMTQGLFGEDYKAVAAKFAAANPLKRVGTAEEAAQAILYLMKNRYVTGENLHIDGGARFA